MNLSEIFIRRPIATTLLTMGIALAGIAAYTQLPVAPLPNTDLPVIFVSASMAGASPETMASSVATPLERHLGSIADVTQMTSTSGVGTTNVVLVFGLDRDIAGAGRDVQAAINAAKDDLPAALRSPPTYRPFNPASFPVLILTLTSATMNEGQLYDEANTILSPKLSEVSGVGDVTVSGSSPPAVRVELNPTTLFKYGIGLEDVRAGLAAANANSPKGAIEDADHRWQIYCNDQARTAAQYRSLIIAYRNGSAIRLSDVGTVVDSVEDEHNLGLSKEGQPAVLIQVTQQPGANIIDVVDRLRAMLPQLEESMPPAATLSVVMDRSIMIRTSLHDVEISLLISIILVALVVFLFLRDGHATAIPCVAVPISLIGTFGAMYVLHYSLDNLSLMALTIATGFVVDDAIVVMENIVRHMELGTPRFEAALIGVREVGFTVLSMSLSLIAVFIPILLMGGVMGMFFQEFGICLSVSILISMVISLTTTPMMCSLLLRPHHGNEQGRFFHWTEEIFNDLLGTYERSLAWALRHPPLIMLILAITVGLNVWLYRLIPMGFFPEQDTGNLIANIQADQSISFQLMSVKLRNFVKILAKDPAVANAVGTVGGGGGRSSSTNSGRVFISLKPLSERKVSMEDVMTRMRPLLASVPGATCFLFPIQDVGGGGGRSSNATYQYTLQGDDIQDLRTWTPRLVDALENDPANEGILTDVNSDQQDRGLETDLVVDRNTASRLGLTASQVDNTLYDAFGQRQVSVIYEPLNQYHVIMVVAPKYWQDPKSLRDIYVSTAGGAVSGVESTNAVAGTVSASKSSKASASSVASDAARNAAMNSIASTGRGGSSTGEAVSTVQESMIPLSAFAHYQTGNTALAVAHTGQFASATVSFNLVPGVALSEAVRAIDHEMSVIHLPASITGSFQGNARSFQTLTSSMPLLLLAALVAIYLILGILYESYAHPLTILSTLPSAGVGALLALMLFHTELSLIAFIGIFLLIGIVKKNAIMMIDFAIVAERDEGLHPRDAIYKACLLRFRPIMMTTMAAMLGAVPLAIGFGAGAELRRPLGISIVGGLMVSQVLTLYTTPVVYLYIDRFRLWCLRMRSGAPRPASAAEGHPVHT